MSGFEFRDACEAGDLDKVKGLIGSVDLNEIDECGYTGLHFACEYGHIKIVEELMAAGANLDPMVFDSYMLPLHMAINKNHTDIAKKLIEAGAKIDELTYAGACCTPLHYAILKDNPDLIKLLISKKCDVNLADELNGNTPLYIATTLDKVDIVKQLITAGADVNIADWDDKTPLHFAASSGFGEIALLLVKAKADLNAKDSTGVTPLEAADKVKEDEMMKFLTECASGKVPAQAPKAKVREARVFKEVIPIEGCGEGCANPNA